MGGKQMARNRNSSQASSSLDTTSAGAARSRVALAADADSDRTRVVGEILRVVLDALPPGKRVPDHLNLLISATICNEELRNAGGASAEVIAQVLGALGIRTVWP